MTLYSAVEWHKVTCSYTYKIGLESYGMAVVYSHAKVFGVEGVRVVDVSAFPFLPPVYPQSMVCMVCTFPNLKHQMSCC